MLGAWPHYLLMTEVHPAGEEDLVGRWKFVLQQVGGSERIEASDSEPDSSSERLHLLSVVRGLEELDQPSEVKLITPSRFVVSGIRSGLEQWRENGWMWERFGEMAPVKYVDLWQRVDRACQIHRLECRIWRLNRQLDTPSVNSSVRRSPVIPLPNWMGWEWTQRFGYPVAIPTQVGLVHG